MTNPPVTLPLTSYGCRLGRRELDSLFTTASQGFVSTEIEVSHERHSRVFSAPSLAELIAAVQAAPLPGNPEEWDNIKFTATDPSGGRTVTMHLTPQMVSATVTGTDANLVYGTHTQIRIFLEDKTIGGRDSPVSEPRRQLRKSLTGLAVFGFMTVYGVFWYTPEPGAAPPPLTFLGLIMTAIFGFAVKEWLQDRTSRGCLEPTRNLLVGSLWSRLPMMERLTAIAAMIAAVAAIGTLVSAGSDFFKSG